MKGIILAGGLGTRLYPITRCVSKQLLPIYDKPMIYYPLSVIMLAGVREVLIISTLKDLELYRNLFLDGSQLGLDITYKAQQTPRGLADAFLLGEEFIGDDSVCLILGDNIFYGTGIVDTMKKALSRKQGATIFAYYVNNPTDFGVVEFDKNNKVRSIEEKPSLPKSNYAVPGLYFYDNKVIKYAKETKPSARGEIEITSINNRYLLDDMLYVEKLGRGIAWLDTGTPRGLLEACNFVEAVQSRQGLYIACIEEIAYRLNYISKKGLQDLALPLAKTEYGEYLLKLLQNTTMGE